MTVCFLLDYSIFADKRSFRFLPGGYSVGVLGIGRQRRQGNDIIQYIDFHLISPFSTMYLLTGSLSIISGCPKSETPLI